MNFKFIFYTLFFVLFLLGINTVYAQESQISVQTDDNNYDEGDTIIISGQITSVIGGTPITLQIFSEGNIVDIASVTVSHDGSYSHTIIAEGPLWKKQGDYTVRVSYGEGNIAEIEFYFETPTAPLPGEMIPLDIKFDKLNYMSEETAIITLSGKPSEVINLLIIDPFDKPIGESTSITLQPDGRATHSINLDGFSSGIYNAVISTGTTQSTEVFTVGLQTGSGEIKITTTKTEYNPGDSILILGDTDSNVLFTITLIDPDGNTIKEKETFSNRNGKISESSFRIPLDGKSGTWTITAKNNSNLIGVNISVGERHDGLTVYVETGQDIPGFGKTVNIHVFGAKQTVTIKIISEDGEIIEELAFPASNEGEINQPWIIPRDTEPGIYTIRVSDAFDEAETTFGIFLSDDEIIIQLEKDIDELRMENDDLKSENKHLSKQNKKLTKNIDSLNDEILFLEKKLEKLNDVLFKQIQTIHDFIVKKK